MAGKGAVEAGLRATAGGSAQHSPPPPGERTGMRPREVSEEGGAQRLLVAALSGCGWGWTDVRADGQTS